LPLNYCDKFAENVVRDYTDHMAGNEEATVLDLEEIVDESLREIEERRRQHHMLRLDESLRKLDALEQELDDFLRSRPVGQA
jgi:hypothetical protein